MIISCIVVLSYLKKTKVYKTIKVTNYFSIYVQLMRLPKVKQLPMAAITGVDPEIFDRGGGGGVQTLVQKGLLNFFCGKLLLPHTPSHQSQLHRSWKGAQIKQLHFSISLEFSLVAKCNARFIKKNQPV